MVDVNFQVSVTTQKNAERKSISKFVKIINECYAKVLHIIETHREQLELIAQTLIEVETIDRKEIVALYQFGKMPKDLDEREADQLDKVVNKKYYEEEARKAKEEAEKKAQEEAKNEEDKVEKVEEKRPRRRKIKRKTF